MSRGFRALRFVEPGAAEFADGADRACLAKAIGHALGDPPIDAEALGELARVKGLRERCREQAREIGSGAECVRCVDFEEMLIFDDVIAIAIPAAAAVARVAVLFDFDQRHFDVSRLCGKTRVK